MNLKYDILHISSRAKKDEKNNKVINGVVGSFFDDNKKLIKYDNIASNLTKYAQDYLSYGSVIGNEKYFEGIFKWLFNDNYLSYYKKENLFKMATFGGTGAIYSTFKFFKDQNVLTLIPDICWTNYFSICDEASMNYKTYSLFKDNKFNFESLINLIESSLNKYNKILLLINDPCQNPTGYSLTKEEYEKLFSILNKYNENNNLIDVLFDIAYFNFKNDECHLFSYLINEYKFNIFISFSGSKIFGIYGLRIGALFVLLNDKNKINYLNDKMYLMTRGSYSCPNNQIQNILANILNDEVEIKSLRNDFNFKKNILKNRSEYILKLLKENNILYCPYDSGFFITIKVKNDSYQVCDELEKRHIYLVPMDNNLIRVALCSLNLDEIKEIIKVLKDIDK